MSNLMGQVGEVTFTVEIKRKDTGKIDTFNLVGKVTEEQLKELTNVSDALDSSKERGD